MSRDLAVFLTQILRRPMQIGAIAPSSSAVARHMTEGLEQVEGPIVEFGPGTGSFTRAILERGIAPERLTLMEMNPVFCENLRRKFPGVRVLNRPAQEISDIGEKNVGAVVSGIPILARPQIQREMLGNALKVLAPNGYIIQFTYGFDTPIPRQLQDDLGVSVERRATVWANLPPARVFVFRRMQH
ncbi:class I SAM-dependent methyltransferase [Thalassovita sp.]|uniref:class I SAM-dependent methyltransferase n=1 Tax=Thalassovita sp. TaxID=1979401 RepID=UPI0029DE7F7A|nr:methyltransferase domain-containing protein [Thalassovita sp.]